MAEIPLRDRSGAVVAFAIVDDHEMERVEAAGPWHRTKKGYARNNIKVGRPRTSLHRFILGVPPGVQVDHRDGDRLNCQIDNLRPATNAMNAQNRASRGVYRNKGRGKPWFAKHCLNGRHVHIGYFDTEQEALDAAAAWREINMPHRERAAH